MSAPIPRPGEHLPGPSPTVDRDAVVAEVDGLLSEVDDLSTSGSDVDPDSEHALASLHRQARILEQAHQVLVDALAAVDKN
jgi:ABC-type transporter Mla subunit MlaD